MKMRRRKDGKKGNNIIDVWKHPSRRSFIFSGATRHRL